MTRHSLSRILRSRTPLLFTAVLAAAFFALFAAVPAAHAKEGSKSGSKEEWKGKPEFEKGESRGYFIWGDGEGWHVRWLSKGAKRTYSGTVTSDVALDKFEPVSRDSKDFIKQDGDRTIKFDANTKEGMDGFNFRPSPSTKVLRFELSINGATAPVDEVKLGKHKTRASAVPVVINLAGGNTNPTNPKAK